MREVLHRTLAVAGIARPLMPGPTPLIKVAAWAMGILPSPPLSPNAVDFINQPAVVDNGLLMRAMPRTMTRLETGLATYLGPRPSTLRMLDPRHEGVAASRLTGGRTGGTHGRDADTPPRCARDAPADPAGRIAGHLRARRASHVAARLQNRCRWRSRARATGTEHPHGDPTRPRGAPGDHACSPAGRLAAGHHASPSRRHRRRCRHGHRDGGHPRSGFGCQGAGGGRAGAPHQ